MTRRIAFAMAGCALTAVFVIAGAGSPKEATAQPSVPDLADLVFVTEDRWLPAEGCDSISVFSVPGGSPVHRGVSGPVMSPGRLAASPDFSTIVAAPTNGGAYVGEVMARDPGSASGWRTLGVLQFPEDDVEPAFQSSIAVLADGDEILVPALRVGPGIGRGRRIEGVELRKYRLSDVAWRGDMTGILGRPLGAIELEADEIPIDMVTEDGRIVHVVAWREVYSVDADTMTRAGSDIDLPGDLAVSGVTAELTQGSDYLIASAPGGSSDDRRVMPEVFVVDLHVRTSWRLRVPGLPAGDTWIPAGLDLNRAEINSGVLAVHGGDRIVFVRFDPKGPLELIGSVRVLRPWGTNGPRSGLAPLGSVAWSADGSHVIAGSIYSDAEFAILRVTENGAVATLVNRLTVCKSSRNFPNDVLTANGYVPTATPTPPRPTATDAPATRAPTATATATSTATTWATATATTTSEPAPVFLPITLREHCNPEYQRSDIALVIDTSSSMTGQKIADARAAALAFVGMIDLAPGRSQVTVVRYDREAEAVRELTRARATLEAAIRSLRVRSGTHIDKGLRAALAELQCVRHIERNTQVLVLLTDGVQTGTPREELRAAEEVRQAGVRLYAIGLGADVDEATLRAIAGDNDRYYFAPDSSDLARIYSEIAVDLMCPGKDMWAEGR